MRGGLSKFEGTPSAALSPQLPFSECLRRYEQSRDGSAENTHNEANDLSLAVTKIRESPWRLTFKVTGRPRPKAGGNLQRSLQAVG